MTWWLDLRRHPALLAFYAAGISLTRRNRFGPFRTLLLDTDIRKLSTGQRSTALEELDPADVVDSSFVQVLFVPHRKTPISDLLHEALRGAFRDLIPGDEDYTRAFDRFEALVALIVADRNPAQPWLTIGAFSWRRIDDNGALNEILRESEKGGKGVAALCGRFLSAARQRNSRLQSRRWLNSRSAWLGVESA